jgi:hypothetical protein
VGFQSQRNVSPQIGRYSRQYSTKQQLTALLPSSISENHERITRASVALAALQGNQPFDFGQRRDKVRDSLIDPRIDLDQHLAMITHESRPMQKRSRRSGIISPLESKDHPKGACDRLPNG